ncbi:MAG: hypothetical protein AB7P21_24270 [Lautropia sp.]
MQDSRAIHDSRTLRDTHEGHPLLVCALFAVVAVLLLIGAVL